MEQLLSLLKTIPEYAAMVSSLQDLSLIHI